MDYVSHATLMPWEFETAEVQEHCSSLNMNIVCEMTLLQALLSPGVGLLLWESLSLTEKITKTSMIELKTPIDRDIAPQANHTRTNTA